MFESFAQLFPADWQGAVLTLLAPMRWLAAWQSTIGLAWGGNNAARALAWIAGSTNGHELSACSRGTFWQTASRAGCGDHAHWYRLRVGAAPGARCRCAIRRGFIASPSIGAERTNQRGRIDCPRAPD